jgi:hypothetical protein
MLRPLGHDTELARAQCHGLVPLENLRHPSVGVTVGVKLGDVDDLSPRAPLDRRARSLDPELRLILPLDNLRPVLQCVG